MSQEYFQKVEKALRDKKIEPQCQCDSKNFDVHIPVVMNVNENPDKSEDGCLDRRKGAKPLLFIPLVCKNCGYTELYHPKYLGIEL
ncbi:MAG: hypothetical protein ACYS8W_07530 [Planctomycetota bacterium]|jgi:hypothetical protein